MRIRWAVFQAEGRSVEAQIFEPETATDNVILFCPGFPGMGAPHFEQRHAATFVQEGYAVVTLRHGGTRLDGPAAPAMVNNAARLYQGRQNRHTHLGGGPSAVAHWLSEPLAALPILAAAYNNIFVLGNSFGALSAMWSLTDSAAPLDKVRKLILVAGAQGMPDQNPVNDIMRIWQPAFMTVSRITDKVSLKSVDDDVRTLRDAYIRMPERMKTLPDRIGLTYLVVAKDELLTLGDTERFKAAIAGRGKILIDDMDKAYLDHGLIAHDMPDYPTENFLALIKE